VCEGGVRINGWGQSNVGKSSSRIEKAIWEELLFYQFTAREGTTMTAKKPWYLVGLILSPMLLSPHLLAAQCTIDSNFMDRGERKAFIICGKDIPRNYTLKGLSEANIIIEYEQYLEMCGIGIDTPGIYLIANAKADAQTASVSILSADTQEAVCEDLTVFGTKQNPHP
jgi:hypothetical protein